MKRSMISRALALCLPTLALSGCYVVPIGSDQLDKLTQLMEQAQAASYGAARNPAPSQPPTQNAGQGASQQKTIPVAAHAGGPSTVSVPVGPTTLHARLYPVNDIATDNGMVSGTVTSMMNGKARFQLNYRGELLVGEATRVSGDDRKGVATAWGPNGSFMSCEYQMSSLVRGAGTCSFSDGARYQVHVGN